MGRQQKNIIFAVAALIVLGGLIGVYFWQQAAQKEADTLAAAEPTEEPVNLKLIEHTAPPSEAPAEGTDTATQVTEAPSDGPVHTKEGVVKIEFINESGSYVILPRIVDDATEWYLEADPDLVLDQTTMNSQTLFSRALTATSRLQESVEDTAEYGINPSSARAIATYADGSTEVVHVGKKTPDQNNYYVMVEGNPALYLLSNGAGARYFNRIGDIVDKSLPVINTEFIDYFLIAERGKPTIEFDFVGTQEERETMQEQYGGLVLKMIQPHYGRDLYTGSLKVYLLDRITGMTIGDLVELNAADLSVYGLDEPSLEFWYKFQEDEIHLLFGDQTEDGNIYVKRFDTNQVYLMAYADMSALYGLDPLSVVEKFVALVDIMKCDSVNIEDYTGTKKSYLFEMNHDVLPPEEGEEEGEAIMNTKVNGAVVDEEMFKDIYRLLIGLSIEDMLADYVPSGEPMFKAAYTMNTGEPPIELTFYDYSDHFYVVEKSGEELHYVTGKLGVDLFFEGAAGAGF
jgi:hypothetical protein